MKEKRVAATIALGLLLHVVFSNTGSDYNLAFAYWLAYALVCALLLNYDDKISTLQLATMSLPSPVVVALSSYYRVLFHPGDKNRGCWLSGVKCEITTDFHLKAASFVLASLLFIWIFSHMSLWLLSGISRIGNLSKARAKSIRERIVWVGAILLAIMGVAQIIASGWKR